MMTKKIPQHIVQKFFSATTLGGLSSVFLLFSMLIPFYGCGGEDDPTVSEDSALSSFGRGDDRDRGRRSFTFSSESMTGVPSPCQIMFLPVLIDPSVVPPPFVPVTSQGRAPGMVASLNCPVGVNGEAPSPTFWSEVTISIESPDGTPGSHSYQLSLISNNPEIQDRLRAMGFGVFGQLVPQITFKSSGSGVIQYESRVPWSVSRYAISSAIPEPTPILDHAVFKTWHKGDRGIVRFIFDAMHLRQGIGFGTLTVEWGSPLARWLGATRITGEADILAIDVNTQIDLCGASFQGCPNP